MALYNKNYFCLKILTVTLSNVNESSGVECIRK